MKRHSMTSILVLRPVEMHRETFVFCLTLFIHKSKLTPFPSHCTIFPDMLGKWCNFHINSVEILLHTQNVEAFFDAFLKT